MCFLSSIYLIIKDLWRRSSTPVFNSSEFSIISLSSVLSIPFGNILINLKIWIENSLIYLICCKVLFTVAFKIDYSSVSFSIFYYYVKLLSNSLQASSKVLDSSNVAQNNWIVKGCPLRLFLKKSAL